MAISDVLAAGRLAAELRMDSVGRFFYETGRGALDPVTKKKPPIYATRANGVPCRFSATRSANARETSPADATGVDLARELSIPVDSPAVKAGDLFVLTTVGPETDPALAEITWRVIDPGAVSQATARRLQVKVDL